MVKMNTLVEINKYYNFPTDKGSGQGVPNTGHCYLNEYDKIFERFRNESVNLLEIGLAVGGSLLLWKKYFKYAKNIVGIDIDTSRVGVYEYFPDETLSKLGINKTISPYNVFDWNKDIKIVQTDIKLYKDSMLDDIKFDIIIDDGSHAHHDQKFVIENFISRLNKNGILVIEDIQPHSHELVYEFAKTIPNSYVLDLRHIQGQYDDILYIVNNL